MDIMQCKKKSGFVISFSGAFVNGDWPKQSIISPVVTNN